ARHCWFIIPTEKFLVCLWAFDHGSAITTIPTCRRTDLMNKQANRQRQRGRITNAAFKKKNPNYQRGYKVTRNPPDALRIPLLERPSLWIAPELDGGGRRRDGIWLSPSDEKA